MKSIVLLDSEICSKIGNGLWPLSMGGITRTEFSFFGAFFFSRSAQNFPELSRQMKLFSVLFKYSAPSHN